MKIIARTYSERRKTPNLKLGFWSREIAEVIDGRETYHVQDTFLILLSFFFFFFLDIPFPLRFSFFPPL